MDFDAPGAAERATQALQAQGIQAQMAKVRDVGPFLTVTFKSYVRTPPARPPPQMISSFKQRHKHRKSTT